MSTVSVCRALYTLFEGISDEIKARIVRIAFDGTSATSLLVDRDSGAVLTAPKLYNEAQPSASVELAAVCPTASIHPALSGA